jgi:drug/metabolite transporter (DMT)-like permease
MAAITLSSGLMSLIFGLSPIFSGVLAQKFLAEPKLSIIRKLSMLISLTGLAIVCSGSISINSNSQMGLMYILIAVFLFSCSGILVKSIKLTINPVATTVGSLIVSLPLFFLTWLLMDGTLPIHQWQAKSLWSILYLGVLASLLGFVAYFYVLQKLSATTVALITMMTPVLAMSLGSYLNNEIISLDLIVGAFLVMVGLTIYHWGDRVFVKPLVE